MSVYINSFLKTNVKEEYYINIYVVLTGNARNAMVVRNGEDRYLTEYLLINVQR